MTYSKTAFPLFAFECGSPARLSSSKNLLIGLFSHQTDTVYACVRVNCKTVIRIGKMWHSASLTGYTPLAMAQAPTQQRPMTALDVARCLIHLANKEHEVLLKKADGDPHVAQIRKGAITPLKLQKVLYFAQAASLVTRKEPLFNDDFQAWQLGPVIYQVYKEFQKYNADLIPASEGSCENVSPDVQAFLQKVWDSFGRYSSTELVEMTHRHAPWKDTFDPQQRDKIIEKGKMSEYYQDAFATT